MAAMMRFALLGLVLCAASIGLSEQGGSSSLLGCIWRGKALTPEAKEIKEIGDALKVFYFRLPYSMNEKLAKVRTIAKKNPQNSLANLLKDLQLGACDKNGLRAADKALQMVEQNKCHVENQADRLRRVLQNYLTRTKKKCSEEEKIKEAKLARHMLIELSELLDGLGPDSSLTSQLELIASRGSENTLAAKLKGITLGHYDLNALKAVDETIKAIEQVAKHAAEEAKRLRSTLLSCKQQMLKNRMQDLIKDWPENDGALLEQLDEEKLTAVVNLSEIIVKHVVLMVRDDLRPLIAAHRFNQNQKNEDLLIAIKDDITLEIDENLKQHPSWTYHRSDVLDECERYIYKPCEALFALDRADAMKAFYDVTYIADSEMIMDAIGKKGSKGSNLAEWAGRWGACNLILSQDKVSMADAIVQIDKKNFKP